jgi:hypothetical protein
MTQVKKYTSAQHKEAEIGEDHETTLVRRLKVDDSSPRRVLAREGSSIEFKQAFNWGSKDSYSKTLAAFANSSGGYLIFGVKNQPRELVGLLTANFEQQDDATITGFLNEYFSPEVRYVRGTFLLHGVTLGYIYAPPALRKPVMATKNVGEIKEGDIYYRYRAKSERIKYPELAEMMRHIEVSVERRWTDLFARIAQIGPMNAQINPIQTSGSTPATTGLALTHDPLAPKVQISQEDIRTVFPLDYKSLVTKLKDDHSEFKADPRFIQVLNQIKANADLCHIRLLDPGNPKSSKKALYADQAVAEVARLYFKSDDV